MAERRQSVVLGLIRVASGNFLEQYDFFVFGCFAAANGRTCFPHGSTANGAFVRSRRRRRFSVASVT